MKTLFLDFDGVLHPSITSEYFTKLDLMREGINGQPVEIVISSSWRFHHSLDELKNFLGPEIGKRVIATTGDAHIGKFARYQEIKKWVEINRCEKWAILDDSKFEFPDDLDNLILCDPRRGMTDSVVTKLRSWLMEDRVHAS